MKANKVLKRLAKIEALVSDVAQKFSAGAPQVSGVLKDLKAAVARVKDAVSAHASKKKAVPARTKAVSKKSTTKKKVVRAPKAKTAKKAVRVKRAVKKAAAVRTAPIPVQQAETAPQEMTQAN